MDWESAWAGVLKTVDGTDQQLSTLEDGLRGLAKELPASHQEIAAVAEAAGQLGVETDSVVEFTRTMINLGETTNLSAEEAATGLARFSNIMGTSQDDVDRLGSALVGLGNNFETTEGEILATSMRLAGIGAQMGLTEGDVLGMATAMSSVGIEAEAGGTAMTQGMKKIQAAVDEGGESLEGFAEVAGMSSDEFAKLWSEDTSAGLEAFIHGLSRVGEEGGNVAGTLSDLGIKGIRESDTFLRLANNADGFSEALAAGNTEFERNLALTEEATKRYQTTESQLKIAKNAIIDAGVDLGASILPVLADVAGGVADVASWFGSLPGPVQESIALFGSVAGASALLAGGLMKVVPAAQDTIGAFKRIQRRAPGVSKAMGRVALGVGAATAAFAAVSVISAYGDSLTDFGIGANEAADAAMRLADSQNPFQDVFEGMGHDAELANAGAEKLQENLDILNNGHWYEGISNASAGIENAFGANIATTEDLRARLDEVGQGLAGLAQTDLPEAQAAFKALWEQAGATDEAGTNLLDLMPALRDELVGVANAADLATDDQTLLKIATGEIVPEVKDATGAAGEYEDALGGATGEVEEQVDALAELQDLLQGVSDLMLGVRGSARDFEAAIDDASSSVDEYGKTLDTTTEAGRANEASLDGIADAAHRWADAAETSGASAEELDGIMSSGREEFLKAADAMGMGADEAEDLADQLGLVPSYVETEVAVEKQEAEDNLASLQAAIDETGGTVTINGETYEAEEALDYLMSTVDESDGEITINGETIPAEDAVAAFIEALGEEEGVVEVDADTGPARSQFEGLVSDVPPAEVDVTADVEPAWHEVNEFEAAVADAGGTVTINGDAVPADQALDTVMGIINSSDGTVTIDGVTVSAEEALGRAIAVINASGGTVDIDGNPAGANAATDGAKRKADGTTGTIDVEADTAGANSDINSTARDRESDINADANTGSAESQLNRAARNRTTTITVRTVGVQSTITSGRIRGMSARANGGWLNDGLAGGGWVPGQYPGKGVDNVMWPVMQGAAGGRQLAMQPLAGTEFVVNGQSAQQWGPALEAINNGMQPSQMAQNVSASVDSAAITAAVNAGMRGMGVAVNIDGRTLYGAVVDAGKAQRAPFVTRRS
ncbi:MAG: phage tail tape measure protein [Brachybacterium sp.]|nr:phage tail tape measure protein [Brachybacterium sp.]